MNSRLPNKRLEGFSLLEVLIAMAILVVLSLAIYQATTETYRLRDALSVDGDFQNEIRLSMNIMQRDIALLFSPAATAVTGPRPSPLPAGGPGARDPNLAMAETQELQNLLSSDLGQTTEFWGPATDKTALRPSHFIGSDSKFSFVSLSHTRVYKDLPESEFAKIVYELKVDPTPAIQGTSVLVKSSSPDAFETDEHKDKFFVHQPLLHGIRKLAFRYYRKDKNAWSTAWDSDKEDFKNIYPDIIEVKLEVVGPQRLSFEGVFQFRPEVPLNGLDPST